MNAAAFDPTPTAELAGLYGPSSVAWRLNREATLLIAAGPRALLMQIAHPLIAEGVDQHSDFRADPWRRLRGTLRSYLAIVYGTTTTARAEIRRLNALHRSVSGPVRDAAGPRGSGAATYDARDPALALWVHATLVDATIVAYEAWIGPLDPADRARYYEETRPIGRAFGIPDRLLPADLDAFEAYLAAQLGPGGPIRVTPTARELARTILAPPLGPLHPALGPVPPVGLRLDAVAGDRPPAAGHPRRLRPALGPLERLVAGWLTLGFRGWRPLAAGALADDAPGAGRGRPAGARRRPARAARRAARSDGARTGRRGAGARYASAVTTPALLAIDLGTTQAKAGLVGPRRPALGLARAAYPLATDGATGAVGAGSGRLVGRDPVDDGRAPRRGRTGHDPGDRRSTARARPSSRRPPTATRSTRRSPGWTRGRPRRRRTSATATGEAGWVLGILPRALWAQRNVRGRGGRRTLVPRELGVGRAPAERGRRRDEPARAGPSRPASGRPDRTRGRPDPTAGRVGDGPRAAARRTRRASSASHAGIPVVARDGRRPRELHRRGAARAGRCDRHRRDVRRLRGLHRPTRSRSPASSGPPRRSPVAGSSAGR